MLQNLGTGKCDTCLESPRPLFSFHQECVYVRNPGEGRYCPACILTFQQECDVPPREWLRRCDDCFTYMAFKDLLRHERIKHRWWGFCPDCMAKQIRRNSLTCVVCGESTLEYTYLSRIHSTCEKCYVHSPKLAVVMYHNSRAKALNLPATLTTEQWEQAIKHFNHRCAYCPDGPYEVLEHFLPLCLGGGTVANNCVPACHSCNVRKKDKHPNDFSRLFPASNIARITAYLAQHVGVL